MLKSNFKNIFRRLHVAFLRFCGFRRPEIAISGSVLILAPHPDDEAIGCGGLIARLVADGNAPHIAILTGGGGSLRDRCDLPESEVVAARRRLSLNAAAELGLPKENIHFLDFVDGGISERPDAEMERLRNLIDALKPANILVPHSGEGWPDHLATREIGLASAPTDASLFEYCVWMWYYNVWALDWRNARKIHLSPAEHKAKLRAVEAYVTPTSPCGAPWSGVLPPTFLHANTSRTELYFFFPR